MKKATLDGRVLRSRAQVHELLARELGFPPGYGANLDALYDCLTDLSEETVVVLAHTDALAETLGDWAWTLRRVLRDASADNDRLTLEEKEETMDKILFYGADICKDCRAAHPLLEQAGIEADAVDITASTDNLRAFLALRDRHPAFDAVKAEGRIGIPAFVFPDGSVTLGIAWLQGQSGCKNC
ncbi:MAG: barstar family protein [Gemmiger sp.]